MNSVPTSDVANRSPEVYARSAPRILDDIHGTLRERAEKFLAGRPAPVLAVVGPGGDVLPYSRVYSDGKLGGTNREWMKKILGSRGTFLLVDYVSDCKRGLGRARETLSQNGFFEQGYFTEDTGVMADRIELKRGVNYAQRDLCRPLAFPKESIDFFDMTLSMHHATRTRAQLRRICQDCYAAIKPRGVVHIGEGNVDMNHIEDKLIRIGENVCYIVGKPVALVDVRGSVFAAETERSMRETFLEAVGSDKKITFAFFEPGRRYEDLPEVNPSRELFEESFLLQVQGRGIDVDEDSLRGAGVTRELFVERMQAQGYSGANFLPSGALYFPLIDKRSPEDMKKYLLPVHRFYGHLIARASVFRDEPALLDQILNAIEEELMQAECGVCEHYIGEKRIISSLEDVGFQNVESVHHAREPFYNIVAQKPS